MSVAIRYANRQRNSAEYAPENCCKLAANMTYLVGQVEFAVRRLGQARFATTSALEHLRQNDAPNHSANFQKMWASRECGRNGAPENSGWWFESIAAIADVRITFNLYAIEGYSHAEISRNAGITGSYLTLSVPWSTKYSQKMFYHYTGKRICRTIQSNK